MARVLIVTAALTLVPLAGEELALANTGMPGLDDDDGSGEMIDCRFTGTDEDLAEASPREIAELVTEHVVASNEEIWGGTNIGAKFFDATVIGAKWQDGPRSSTADRGVVAAIAAEGVPVEVAEDMVDRVTRALVTQLSASKGVNLNGIGRLVQRKRKKNIVAPGPDRGKRVEEWFVALTGAAVLRRGEPYDPI